MYSMSEYGSTSLVHVAKSLASDDYNEERGERTPLLGSVDGLNNRKIKDDAEIGVAASECEEIMQERISYALLIPAVLLMAGIGVGAFLLHRMYSFPDADLTFLMVERDMWQNRTLLGENFLANVTITPLNASNVVDVFVTQTGGQSCTNTKECSAVINKLQQKYSPSRHALLPYNMLVGGDGKSYEIRGWSAQSGLHNAEPADKSLVLGLIGDFTTSAPFITQLNALKVLLIESVYRRKLQHNYKIYGMRNITDDGYEAKALYDEIENWHHFKAVTTFL